MSRQHVQVIGTIYMHERAHRRQTPHCCANHTWRWLRSFLFGSASKLVGKLRSCMPPTQNVTFRCVDLILLDVWVLILGIFSSFLVALIELGVSRLMGKFRSNRLLTPKVDIFNVDDMIFFCVA